MKELDPSSLNTIQEVVEPEIYLPFDTYIVILCLFLLVLSVILEIIKLKNMKRNGENIKKEIVVFSIIFILSLVGEILYIATNELTAIRGIVCVHSSITLIGLYFSLILSIILVIKSLLYFIKPKKNM